MPRCGCLRTLAKHWIEAREAEGDAFAAIEAVMSWDAFERSVEEARRLARDEAFDALAFIVEHAVRSGVTPRSSWRPSISGPHRCVSR